MRKDGAILDLAIAVGVLKSMNIIYKNIENIVFIGELSLDGNINSVNGILPICIECIKYGIKKVIIPKKNAKEAAIVKELEVIGVTNLREVIDYLNNDIILFKEEVDLQNILNNEIINTIDFSEVKGQETIKRSLEIAASGRS